jgi:L-fucose mutarotase/ribose pyranase (RbsD/FucU family)
MLEPVRSGYAVIANSEQRLHGNIVLASEGGRP